MDKVTLERATEPFSRRKDWAKAQVLAFRWSTDLRRKPVLSEKSKGRRDNGGDLASDSAKGRQAGICNTPEKLKRTRETLLSDWGLKSDKSDG